MNLLLGIIAFILGVALTIVYTCNGWWIALPFSFGLMYLGIVLMSKSKHLK